MTTKPIGLYVHIPFCIKKCNYCDFCSFAVDSVDWRSSYIDALCREIESYGEKKIAVNSIFFGGGTPSLLSAEEFDRIVSCIKKSFNVLEDTEFSIELNPKTIDEEKLRAFVNCGVNRLSIGLQSIHENEMKILGRIHSYKNFLESYKIARQCGIKNINVDLMYGIPEQSLKSFEATIKAVTDLSPEHISLYGLIIEEGTPFYEKRKSLSLPSEDSECDMYYLAADFLKKSGYLHYEISNYAKDGRQCRHNLKYWKDEEYIGFGLSAYSYFDGRRFGNTDNFREYLNLNAVKYSQCEIIDRESEAYEFVMLGLRLAEGFSLEEYQERFGVDFCKGREEIISRFLEEGYLIISDGRFSLTDRGFYVSNSIINELI